MKIKNSNELDDPEDEILMDSNSDSESLSESSEEETIPTLITKNNEEASSSPKIKKQSLYKQYNDIRNGKYLNKRTVQPNRKFASRTIKEPKSYSDAVKDSLWQQAMEEQFQALIKNKTWELVELPASRKAINCKWTYKIKTKANREFERLKARRYRIFPGEGHRL